MRTWRWYSKVLLGLLILAFAYYVWPTPWTCYQLNPSVSSASDNRMGGITEYSFWLRVNRFTGRTEVLSGYRGWQPSKPKR
jgi:hypothetical protein